MGVCAVSNTDFHVITKCLPQHLTLSAMRETRIHHRQDREAHPRHAHTGLRPVPLLIAAAVGGAALGIGSTAFGTDTARPALEAARPVAATLGLARARPPRTGDFWRNCAEAKSVGSAPIYRGEPGYRDRLDGDSDGIACEPYHGR